MDTNTAQPPIIENETTSPTKLKLRWKILSILCVLFLVGVAAGAYYFFILNKQQQRTSDATIVNLPGVGFAEYKEIKSNVTPVIQPYTIKSIELKNLDAVASDANTKFTSEQLKTLETRGFFTQPTKPVVSAPDEILDQRGGRSDDMVDLYAQFGGLTAEWERKPENAVFVTTDFLLHIYHVLIDRSFQKTEEVNFQPTLKQLTDVLYKNSLAKYNEESDPQFKESWKRLSVFYLVPKVLLEASNSKPKQYFSSPEDEEKSFQDDKSIDTPENVAKQLQKYQNTTPAEIYQLASQEITLVMKAEDFGVSSPLYDKLKPDTPEDYTQYGPRSHYMKNSVLRSYFRAMMWYGRHGFDVKSLDLTRDAVLMTWQLGLAKVDGKTASLVWESIYLPTVFFVGKSDDLSLYEYTTLMKSIYGNPPGYASLKDSAKLQQFQSQANKLEGPKILSEIKVFNPNKTPTKEELLQSTKGFRFMGQRFIPDSYMFASLTQGDEQPDPETGQRLPSTPTALMVMSILGSDTADTLLTDWITANTPQSDKVIAKVKNQLKGEFEKYDKKAWTQNIYLSWLYNLKALFEKHEDGYPMFMRGEPWAKKSLVTALGSWTELRHDTLLYAKQSYAEMGGAGEQPPKPPPVPKGYVEPNLAFITRLIALATMTRDGMNTRGLLVPGQKEKFDSFLESLAFFKTIAEKELTDTVISDEEYEKLRTIIRLEYPNIVWTPDGDQMTEEDARAGIIADVHTDAKMGKILYEATGAPSIMYVAVKDKGGTRLARGVTYSYYEFTLPVETRLTDQAWQEMIYEGKNVSTLPSQPSWTHDLMK